MTKYLQKKQRNMFREGGVSKVLTADNRETSSVEVEGGEYIITDTVGDGIPETYSVKGKSHEQGGVPLSLADDSVVMSDWLRETNPEILKQFGKKPNKNDYTYAELAKSYNNNDYKAMLYDENTTKMEKKTAKLMIKNNNEKLAKIVLLQESEKGFSEGIPLFALPYMDSINLTEEEIYGVSPAQVVQGMPIMKEGGSIQEQQRQLPIARGGLTRFLQRVFTDPQPYSSQQQTYTTTENAPIAYDPNRTEYEIGKRYRTNPTDNTSRQYKGHYYTLSEDALTNKRQINADWHMTNVKQSLGDPNDENSDSYKIAKQVAGEGADRAKIKKVADDFYKVLQFNYSFAQDDPEFYSAAIEDKDKSFSNADVRPQYIEKMYSWGKTKGYSDEDLKDILGIESVSNGIVKLKKEKDKFAGSETVKNFQKFYNQGFKTYKDEPDKTWIFKPIGKSDTPEGETSSTDISQEDGLMGSTTLGQILRSQGETENIWGEIEKDATVKGPEDPNYKQRPYTPETIPDSLAKIHAAQALLKNKKAQVPNAPYDYEYGDPLFTHFDNERNQNIAALNTAMMANQAYGDPNAVAAVKANMASVFADANEKLLAQERESNVNLFNKWKDNELNQKNKYNKEYAEYMNGYYDKTQKAEDNYRLDTEKYISNLDKARQNALNNQMTFSATTADNIRVNPLTGQMEFFNGTSPVANQSNYDQGWATELEPIAEQLQEKGVSSSDAWQLAYRISNQNEHQN